MGDPMFDLWRADEEREMRSVIRIRRPAGTAVAGDGSTATSTTSEVYAGRATVLPRERSRTLQIGQQADTISDYLVRIPYGVDVAEGDLVDIVHCDDEAAAGRTIRVARIVAGDRTASREIECEELT